MATLAENGYRTVESRAMHPFFRQRKTRKGLTEYFAYPAVASQPRPATKHINHDPGHDETQDNDGISAGTIANDNALEAFDPAIPALQQECDEHNDGEPDRRKRRKLTPAKDNSHENTWLHQLEEAASEQNPRTAGTDSGRSENHVAGAEDTQEECSLSQPLAKSVNATNSDSATVEAPKGTSPSTPPRKMLKLSRSGTLWQSPRRSSRKVEDPKPSPPKKPQQSRGLTSKKGRLSPSLRVALSYRTIAKNPDSFGAYIDEILAQTLPPTVATLPQIEKKDVAPTIKPSKSLHPFFQGKVQPKQSETSATATGDVVHEGNSEKEAKVPVKPWNQIVFNGVKSSRVKDTGNLAPPWPPRELHHIVPHEPCLRSTAITPRKSTPSKQKRDIARLPETESVFDEFAKTLKTSSNPANALQLPEQHHITGSELLRRLDKDAECHVDSACLESLRHRVRSGQSPFDRGVSAGPLDWTHEYAPKRAVDVLQPASRTLRRWLEQLKVHHVQSKLAIHAARQKRATKKKRVKKRADDLDDFLVSSDDELDESPVKNAIIICGPPGCGKSASVFAVAHELDFEVFEIHPGMRRSAKDIYDRVGDMTHNHLVQRASSAPLSRASSVVSDQTDADEAPSASDPRQKSLAAFVGTKMATNSGIDPPRTVQEREQKQSLILFEEVDVLFDEDKTFWSGVQSLIATSKRPIILTCNSLDSIPLEDFEVAEVLRYTQPSIEDAVKQLIHIAACEGHLLDRQAVRTLYLSRGQDFRAALTELNFWCQMTVGSTMGGIDWMHLSSQSHGDEDVGSQRIVSSKTFHNGLHLVPEQRMSDQDILAFAQDSLDVSLLDWENERQLQTKSISDTAKARSDVLRKADAYYDAKSFMDIASYELSALLGSVISQTFPNPPRTVTRPALTDFILRPPMSEQLTRADLRQTFEPIMEDNRTFPPPTGRTAPSLDGPGSTVALEVAPYVRHIVRLDQQLERQRDEIDASSQGTGRQRKTRTARAAVEGGSVAQTRVERWYPKGLDFAAVEATGGRWNVHDDAPTPRGETPLSGQSTDVTVMEDEDEDGEMNG